MHDATIRIHDLLRPVRYPRYSHANNASRVLYSEILEVPLPQRYLPCCRECLPFSSAVPSNDDVNTDNTMKAVVVSLFSLLAGATAFLPVALIGRNAGSTTLPTPSSHAVRARPLSMGFDFKSTMEKMSDTRYARVRHILVEEKGEEGKAKLEEAKAEIDGDLDKFSEVAERMSTCTSAVR